MREDGQLEYANNKQGLRNCARREITIIKTLLIIQKETEIES